MNGEPLQRLAAEFTRLPGVGKKTALRYAYGILNMSEEEVGDFAAAMLDAKRLIKFCTVCGNYTDMDVCELCQTRDKRVICVVKDPRDVTAFEKIKEYRGVYHVLHGTLDPIKGIGPEDLRVKELLARLDGVEEVIMATNPDIEGEATATYLARLIKPMGIKVTRLAHGIPIGSDIEYTDEVTLGRALSDRKPI